MSITLYPRPFDFRGDILKIETVKYSADLCVIGGGLAGVCAAVAAAREGIKVVLMHERPVLGGNASSEIRMWVCGAQGKNTAETGIMEEIFLENLRINPYKSHFIFDVLLWNLVKKEPNITLLLNCSCMSAEMVNKKVISSVTGWQMTTQKFCEVRASYFADCSGDSITAPLTGAEYRDGREAADEFGENVSTKTADKKTMGNSCLIQAHKGNVPVKFTAPDFAKKLTADDLKFRKPNMKSSAENFWYLELGGDRDTIGDAETVRDELVALAYGMWDYIKNSGEYEDAELWQLDFVGFLPGKRESRRMMGKIILNQNDILSDRAFPDVAAYGGWPLDDHDPAGFYYDGHPNTSYKTPDTYAIPYRALYSVNRDNLFFAGRNISMTHAAMSSVRVMATCAVCGQAVGTAAAIAAKHCASPHGVYLKHIDELQEALLWNDCYLPHCPRKVNSLTRKAELYLNGEKNSSAEVLRDGNDRENLLECEPESTVEYRFKEAEKISEIRIVFDSDLSRDTLPGDKCERTHMTRCNLLPDSPVMHLPETLCKDYIVYGITADGEKVILKEEKENSQRLVKIPADGYFTAAGLKMNKANHNGKTMRIFSFDIR